MCPDPGSAHFLIFLPVNGCPLQPRENIPKLGPQLPCGDTRSLRMFFPYCDSDVHSIVRTAKSVPVIPPLWSISGMGAQPDQRPGSAGAGGQSGPMALWGSPCALDNLPPIVIECSGALEQEPSHSPGFAWDYRACRSDLAASHSCCPDVCIPVWRARRPQRRPGWRG